MIEAIERLKQLEGARFSEVCEKHTFECYRLRSDGCMQEVTVIILDAGPGAAPHARFYCHAKSEEGRVVSSSLEPTLDAALASIRWTELDPPEPVPEPQGDPARTEFDRKGLFDGFRRRLARKVQGEDER
jgi:hypothetical protein